jgi:serine/threonine protein kinase
MARPRPRPQHIVDCMCIIHPESHLRVIYELGGLLGGPYCIRVVCLGKEDLSHIHYSDLVGDPSTWSTLSLACVIHDSDAVGTETTPQAVAAAWQEDTVNILDWVIVATTRQLVSHGLSVDSQLTRAMLKGPFLAKLTLASCTYFYAAPEVLMESQRYGFAADMWNIGTVLGKMLCGRTLFATCTSSDSTEQAVVKTIIHVLGSPPETYWPGFEDDVPHGCWRPHGMVVASILVNGQHGPDQMAQLSV